MSRHQALGFTEYSAFASDVDMSILLYKFYLLELSHDASNVKSEVLPHQVNLALCIDVIHEADGHFVSPANETAQVDRNRPV